MQIKYFQKGFNYAQDGPGNRLVYHLQGCNLRCPWCSNPEGMFNKGECHTVTVEELIDEAVRAKPMFFEGGGVTFTGGEATLQFEALKAALAGLQVAGISTALETNGTSPRLPELFDRLDHLIIDLKHPDDARHRTLTGLGNRQIKQNIIEAAASGCPLLVRMPLIGGVNTDPETRELAIRFFETVAGKNVSFELLKYHEYGKDKWQQCGLTYTVTNAFVPETLRQEMEQAMKQRGLRVIRT